MAAAGDPCPRCGGQDRILALVNRGGGRGGAETRDCATCAGVGVISAIEAARLRAGAALREGRVAAGRLLSGSDEEWKRPLARMLGEHHPDGPRETLDPRGVDRWASGAREIPEWVGPAVARLLTDLADGLESEAAAARAVAARLAG